MLHCMLVRLMSCYRRMTTLGKTYSAKRVFRLLKKLYMHHVRDRHLKPVQCGDRLHVKLIRICRVQSKIINKINSYRFSALHRLGLQPLHAHDGIPT